MLDFRPVCVWAHGWAYSLDFFEPLLLDLQQSHSARREQFRMLGLEQGYFERAAGVYEWTGNRWEDAQSEKALLFDPKNSPAAIGIGHSLGFAKLLEMPMHWASLISLHGFTRFTAHEKGQSGTPKRLLERMLSKLSTHPDAVLQDFWTRAEDHALTAHAHFRRVDTVKLEKLSLDLHAMLELDCTPTLRQFPEHQLLAMCSPEDQIVSPDLASDTFPAQRMQKAMTAHSGPLISPKVYTSSVAQVLSKTLGQPPV